MSRKGVLVERRCTHHFAKVGEFFPRKTVPADLKPHVGANLGYKGLPFQCVKKQQHVTEAIKPHLSGYEAEKKQSHLSERDWLKNPKCSKMNILVGDFTALSTQVFSL